MDYVEKIKQARKAGYNDQQIKTYLKSKGMESSIVDDVPTSRFGMPTVKGVIGATKDVGIGFGKGFLESSIGTARMIQGAGQRAVAAIDPTRTLDEVRSETGLRSLQGKDAAQIDDQLKSTNTEQKVGKVLEFASSLFYPVGKAEEVASVLNKGKNVAGATFEGLGSKVSGIADDIVEGGTKIKDKVSDLIFNLDDRTKTALKRTPKEVFDSFVQKGKDALMDDKNRTPLESVGDQVIDGLKQMKDRATSIAEQKSGFLNQAKVGLQRTGTMVRDAVLKVQKTFSQMKIDESDRKLVNNFFGELRKLGDNPTLKELDKTIDLLQETLYKSSRSDAVEVTNRIIGPLRTILGELNGKAQKLGGKAYENFNKQYSELIEIVTELNARVGKEGGGAGAFVKRLFSPSDARTKYLFEQLQKYTGQDYFRDARLAKFVMDALGDTRVQSILEQLPLTKRGIVEKAVDYGMKIISDPLKTASRFLKN